MELHLARQPIFDRQLNVQAYELLYRSSTENSFDGTDDTTASLHVMSTSFLSMGLDKVSGGKPCYLNVGKDLLVDGCGWLAPPEMFVIEVLESVPRDAEVYQACRDLRDRGFQLALDDFVGTEASDPLIDLASVVKVDFRGASRSDLEILSRNLKRRGVTLLAEKVETQEEFEWASRHGYSYFQGYFFCRPVMMSSREVPGFKLNYMRILAEVHKLEIDLDQVTELLKREPSLCRRLLRYINSAAFTWRSNVESIRRTLILLGEREMRRWVTLSALPGMATDKPDELVLDSMLRARFCETIASVAGLGKRQEELFLMGMFSHLDAMMDKPMEELLADFPLSDEVREALYLRHRPGNRVAEVYGLVLAYESADWPQMSEYAARLGVSCHEVSELYLEAVNWATLIYQDVGHPAVQ